MRLRLRRPAAHLATGLVLALTLAMVPQIGPDRADAAQAGQPAPAQGYLVGRGIADVTGEPAEVGFMGYGDLTQTGEGLHMRQRSRAFVIADAASGKRVVHVVADVGMIFQSVRDAVLAKLEQRFGDTYGETNVMLTATHTHAGVGGFSHHTLYNLTTMGFHGKTFDAIVDGIVASIARAHVDLAPAELRLSTSQLTNANVNRSMVAFNLNPAADRAYFPGGTDTQSTSLQVRRGGVLDGVVNWFPVHATSMSTGNHLISPDNKGYAQYRWERLTRGVDYVADETPEFIASFAQTNAGDMSPNLNLHPTDGPTKDEFENTRILGERQFTAAYDGLGSSVQKVTGGVDFRTVYVDLADVAVRGEFTPDGRPQRTCSASLGASFTGGSTEDGGGGLPLFSEGTGLLNPVLGPLTDVLYEATPALKACQAPKDILLPVGDLDMVQQKLPVQLFRIGGLYLIGMPAEVTVVAGLRLRKAVAKVVGAELRNVLVQGYANAYAHYVTTPEEYDAEQYEGSSTLFGRYELPAFTQVASDLAVAMRGGREVPLGEKESDRSGAQLPSPAGAVIFDAPQLFKSFGDVLTPPRAAYLRGEQVSVVFAGAHPNNNLRHGGTYLAVERLTSTGWARVADDGDWSTKFRWARDGLAASKATVTWDIPAGTPAGSYRIRYFGDARNLLGTVKAFTGTSPTFTVGG